VALSRESNSVLKRDADSGKEADGSASIKGLGSMLMVVVESCLLLPARRAARYSTNNFARDKQAPF
jgi:hypothetical protein